MQTNGGMMDLLREMFRYHAWATLQLIDNCMGQPPEAMHEVVVGTDRSILHTLTHVVGTEQWYLEALTGEPAAAPIRRGEVPSLSDLRRRCESQSLRWDVLLDRIAQLNVTIPADDSRPETPHGQNLLVVQAIQHGIDHRTQICTALRVLGLEPPNIDGWSCWAATHQPEV
jgi:uncharacterized damage-inducible protein DinB